MLASANKIDESFAIIYDILFLNSWFSLVRRLHVDGFSR